MALTGCSEEDGGDGSKYVDQDPALKAAKMKAVTRARKQAVRFCSRQLRSAMRVACFHWGFKASSSDDGIEASKLAPFEAGDPSSGSGQVDLKTALACIRSALFLACEQESWASVESFNRHGASGGGNGEEALDEKEDGIDGAIARESARFVRGAARGIDGLGQGRLLDPSILTTSIIRVSKGLGFASSRSAAGKSKVAAATNGSGST